MPLTHTRTFRVRHYECDAFGYVAPSGYVRYMQETAFDASAAAGYDTARYQAMGRSWLIRETDIEYLLPLGYGDFVEVKTWVADFRRVRSRREYEIRLANNGALAAHAFADWAFIDVGAGRPAAIPAEMVAAFIPEGVAQPASPRLHLSLPEPPAGAFRLRRRVEWDDLDPGQHVNNAVFVTYIEDCAFQATAEHGWTPERMRREGFRVTPLRHQIEYVQPALHDDELDLTTWLADLDGMSAVRFCNIARSGSLLVRSRTRWGCRYLTTGQVFPLPPALRQDLAPSLVGQRTQTTNS